MIDKAHLAKSTDEAEETPEEVEDEHGVWLEDSGVDPGRQGVHQDVQVRTQSEPGGMSHKYNRTSF